MTEKATVKLDGVELAATSPIVWRLQTGTDPYMSAFSVHESDWSKLASKLGEFVTLDIEDARGVRTRIEKLTILHTLPSESPNRVRFVVADRRWRWSYPLITRDYNVARKSGDRTAFNTVPVEATVTVDQYVYRPYSLQPDGKRWTAKKAVEDVLKTLLKEIGEKQSDIEIASFPIAQEDFNQPGQFSLQNMILRDQGSVALARILAYVPGAAVTIDTRGKIVVFDAADLLAAEQHLDTLPSTWDADFPAKIDRKAVRPSDVVVHYQREVELLCSFEDEYVATSSQPNRNAPFLTNVLPTVDPETTVTEYDPELGASVTKVVPAGTWLRVDTWLAAMDADRPEGSLPWTFDTIKHHWVTGSLEVVLGGTNAIDTKPEANASMRVAALRQHFRQTFQLNRRYVDRLRDIRAVRVGLLDPVTGARQPAAVWGEYCVVASDKGARVAPADGGFGGARYTNVSTVPPAGFNCAEATSSPAHVSVIDEDLGIFRIDWITSPYGTVADILPFRLVGDQGQLQVAVDDLEFQGSMPMSFGLKMQGAANGLLVRSSMECKVMLTIVPAAPNDRRQFHKMKVEAADAEDVFESELRLQDGNGPRLHVFVPPGEATARFAWKDDATADDAIAKLLGLTGEEPPEDVFDEDLDGFVLCNRDVELRGHAVAVASEAIAKFADSVQGRVSTPVPEGGLKLVGNMTSASVHVGAYPSAKIMALHDFPGTQQDISRFAMLPDAARQVVLGTLPFGNRVG